VKLGFAGCAIGTSLTVIWQELIFQRSIWTQTVGRRAKLVWGTWSRLTWTQKNGEKMEILNKSSEIKSLLQQGLFVIAQRGTGKTSALVAILREDPNSTVVVHNAAALQRLKELYVTRYGIELGKNRILMGNTPPEKLKGRHVDFLYDLHKVYVDEFFMNEYRGPYFAAVSSSRIPVVIL
jgi:hypothetical protein